MTTYYYVGFAYMMMRKYQDAINTFSSILTYIQRSKNTTPQRSSSFKNDMVCSYFYQATMRVVEGDVDN